MPIIPATAGTKCSIIFLVNCPSSCVRVNFYESCGIHVSYADSSYVMGYVVTDLLNIGTCVLLPIFLFV